LAAAERLALPRIRSANGAKGPTITAAPTHPFEDLFRWRAIDPASGIDPNEITTKGNHMFYLPVLHPITEAGDVSALPKNARVPRLASLSFENN
jgi:hypothetical protein